MIIDAHVHAGHSDALAHSWDSFEDINVSLRRMDRAGIDQAVVLPIGNTGMQQRNRELAEIVRAHPRRLHGFAKVSQAEDAGRVRPMLDEAFGDLGLLGLKLHGHPNREIMEAMDRHRGSTVFDPEAQTRRELAEVRPLLVDVAGSVYNLRYVAEGYPRVPIIVAHMGKFCCIDTGVRVMTMWLAKRYANVYFDTSTVMDHEALEMAVAEGLCHKMIFGSDSPGVHCGVELARIQQLDLTDEQRDLVLHANIAGLIGIGQ